MATVNEVRRQALELPEPDRAALARDLLASLDADEPDEDVEAAWAAEIEARSQAVARGDFTASDWRESVARIRQNLAQRRRT